MSQTSYFAQNVVAYEGMVAYGLADFISKKNATRQLVKILVVTNAADETYTVTIAGTAYEFTNSNPGSKTIVRDGLEALIEAGTQTVTWTDSSTDAGIIENTSREAALVITASSQTSGNLTATEQVPFGQAVSFGRAVCWNEQGADDECRLPRVSTDVGDRIWGVAAADHLIETVPEATSGYYPNFSAISILRRGYIWVICESAITAVGADVYVRYAAGSGGSNLGAFRGDADTSTAAVLPGATFRTRCGAGELCLLELNLTN